MKHFKYLCTELNVGTRVYTVFVSLTNQCPQTGEFNGEGEDAETDDDEIEDVPRDREVGADAEADELRERRTGGGGGEETGEELVVRSVCGLLHCTY